VKEEHKEELIEELNSIRKEMTEAVRDKEKGRQGAQGA
jgi:hypothetical protein